MLTTICKRTCTFAINHGNHYKTLSHQHDTLKSVFNAINKTVTDWETDVILHGDGWLKDVYVGKSVFKGAGNGRFINQDCNENDIIRVSMIDTPGLITFRNKDELSQGISRFGPKHIADFALQELSQTLVQIMYTLIIFK